MRSVVNRGEAEVSTIFINNRLLYCSETLLWSLNQNHLPVAELIKYISEIIMTTSRRITEARRGGRHIRGFVRVAIASRSKNSRKRRTNQRDKDLPIDWCRWQQSRDRECRAITWRRGWPSTLRAGGGGDYRPSSFRYTAKWANWFCLFTDNFLSCYSFMFPV